MHRSRSRWLPPLLAAAFTLTALPALAGPGDRGSLLAMPYLAGSQQSTTLHVSNTGGTDYAVLLQFVSGNPGDDWIETNFRCPLLANATLRISLAAFGAGTSRLDIECGELMQSVVIATTRGLVWVRLENPGGFVPTSDDVLIGNAVIQESLSTYSLEAIAFQKGSGANSGDTIYTFDGVEYTAPPNELLGSFRAVTSTRGTRALLAVIDGRAGLAQPAQVDMLIYAQDSTEFSASYSFDCFADVPLEDISLRFVDGFLGSPIGSFRMVSAPRSQDGKKVAIIGWLVEERLFTGIAAPFASGRAMVWSEEPFVQVGGNPAPAYDGF